MRCCARHEHRPHLRDSRIRVCRAWSPDGEVVAAAGRPKKVGFRDTEHTDQSVRLWTLPDWTPREGRDDLWSVKALVFSPHGDQLTIWLKKSSTVLALRGEPGAPRPIPDDGWDFTSERMARKQAKKGR
jgi:WD40 repeat protein